MLQVSHLSKSYASQVVLDDVSFTMGAGERLGLVGRNGHGKTTLLRLILGEESIDDGSISMPKGYTIGHLSQQLRFDRPTVRDEVVAELGEDADTETWRAEAALMGLGFEWDQLDRPASEFSGGYQIRVELARVLVQQPNLMLLDEPTNYLDIVSMRWLVKTLRAWKNELIIISHDREFMDAVTTHTMAVHRKKLRRMPGTVDKLLSQIIEEEEIKASTIANETKKRRSEERFIERFRSKASKAKLVQSRIKALERRGPLEQLAAERDLEFSFRSQPFYTSTMVRIEDLSFGYGDGPDLMSDLSFTIDHGDRIAIIGPNGRGKTTLLDLLAGEHEPRQGTIRKHDNAAVAHFGQTNVDRLHPDMTVESELLAVDPDQSRGAVRSIAGLLMFSGDAATKPISVLSGGERSRVLLGKLLVSPSNLLLLDEPTNHLDVESIEGLLDAVDVFPGAVVLVTHSEMILERLATRLLIFDRGKVTQFEGGYRDFLDRIGWASEDDDTDTKRNTKSAKKSRPTSKEARRERAALVKERSRATSKLHKAVDVIEKRIETLEAEVAKHDAATAAAAQDGKNEALAEHASAAKHKRDAIDAAFVELEAASEALEAKRAEFDAKLAEFDATA